MRQYLDLMQKIIDEGTPHKDRTGVGTTRLFGAQMRFNLAEGFPLLTTKKMFTKAIIHELLWFLSGDTNTAYLNRHGVKIWDEWADANGDLGPIYGHQWRSWCGGTSRVFDQIKWLINEINTNPESRRLIVTAWNPSDIDSMALPPCHCLFQFSSREMFPDERRSLGSHTKDDVPKRILSCQLYQRSGDIFLGVPFNIASYALLTQMVAQVTGHAVGEFIHTFGDVHLYDNHLDQAYLQLDRTPWHLPKMLLSDDVHHIDGFEYDDFELRNYRPAPAISAPVAV